MGVIGALLYGGVVRGFNAWLDITPSMSVYNFGYAVSLLFFYFSFLNFSLCFFNLIPIPPFDGSRILFTFLPDKLYAQWEKDAPPAPATYTVQYDGNGGAGAMASAAVAVDTAIQPGENTFTRDGKTFKRFEFIG